MANGKVNRFTFDKHSVVLFSALVLAGASSAATGSSRLNVAGAAQASNAVSTVAGQRSLVSTSVLTATSRAEEK